MSVVITIDGPSGAGKGTICRLVAKALNYSLLDSGALYRLTALASLNANIDAQNESDVAQVASGLDIEFVAEPDSTRVLLKGEDVSTAIREEAVGMLASKMAAYPAVRQALLDRQRAFFSSENGLVADGRDMGTVVFPNSPLKIFLTASAQERANRRVKQLQGSGSTNIDEAKILADIVKRDEQDTNRASAPLVPASDALVLDSTELSIDQVKMKVLDLVQERDLG